MAIHINNFNISSFRGITNLNLENLSTINIFVGDNNCGKTSVLESLLLIHKPFSFYNIIRTAIKRENRIRPINRSYLSSYESFMYLFNKLDNFNEIRLSAQLINTNIDWRVSGKINTIFFNENDSNFSNAFANTSDYILEDEIEEFEGILECFINNNHHDNLSLNDFPTHQEIKFNKYSRIQRNMFLEKSIINMTYISSSDYLLDTSFRNIVKDSEVTSDVISLLHIFDEDILNLKIIETDDRRFLQVVDHKSLGTMPISLYGDGFKKVITLANAIVQSKNGILLIDEIETGIHISAMNTVFNWLVKACNKFNVQVFITTHSIETLDQLLIADSSIIDDDLIRVITLIKKHSNTFARILSGEKALKVRNNYDMELR